VSHVEFVALYPKTGKRFSVEVKARERGTGVVDAADVDDVKRLRVANKLNKALGKKAAHTRVVMIEIGGDNVRGLAGDGDGADSSQRTERLSWRREEAERLRVRHQSRLS
jgi:phosphatidylserine decarboxylase